MSLELCFKCCNGEKGCIKKGCITCIFYHFSLHNTSFLHVQSRWEFKKNVKNAKLGFNTLESQTDLVFCFLFYNLHFSHVGTNMSRQLTFTMSHVAKLYQLLSAKLVLPFACMCRSVSLQPHWTPLSWRTDAWHICIHAVLPVCVSLCAGCVQSASVLGPMELPRGPAVRPYTERIPVLSTQQCHTG